ncbi:MAG TPA: hypothetical protein DCZ94_03305 [Lentisphaeria bacterium]|nr:MAG: hypothetical protein A2X48_03970 [Lentisphaerae bacterium GWF2_49_21]HBC85962.1 hypothetical protein [Lentisphaeria bacterium]
MSPGAGNACGKDVADVCYQYVFEAIPFIMIIVGADFKVKALNSPAKSFFGSGPGQKSMNLWDLAPFLLDSKTPIENAMSEGRTQILRRIEYKRGEDKYMDISVCPYSGKDAGRGAVIVIDDVTELEKKEQYIRRSQKMDIVGTLAAGLSHDFNNVINGIKATVDSIKYSLGNMKLTPDALRKQVKDDLEIVEESANRGSDIVEQLLSISRRKELALADVDLAQALKNVLKICGNTLPKTVEIVCEVRDEKAMVKASLTQLEQVLLNLCINASHAMTIMKKEEDEKGGKLSISLEKIYVGPSMCESIPDAKEGYYWLVSVSDTGVGMTKEIMARIFDPFFTTKEKRGTGLGLSMVYNIVKEHRGFIDLFSEPGSGSVFFVFLPVAGDAGAGAGAG